MTHYETIKPAPSRGLANAEMTAIRLEACTFDPAIESYLSEVRKHLRGLVPPSESELFLRDTAYWLNREAAALEADGRSREDALFQAVSARETPQVVAMGIIESYFDSQDNAPLVKRMGRANAYVFILFGGANALYLILLQLALAFPSSSALQSSLSPAQVHRFYPNQLPFPELSWQFLMTMAFPLFVPWFAGWFVGRLIPVYSARAVFNGLLPIIICAAVVAMSLLPDKSGVFYVLLLTFYWLPVGCLTAHFSSSRLRRKRQS